LLKTLALGLVTLFGVTVLDFAVIHLLPGDPIVTMFGLWGSDPKLIAYLRHQYGFDQPLYVQYFQWIVKILRGDLGTSIRYGDPVLKLILERMPATLALILASMVISLSISIPVGVLSASKRHSLRDYAGSVFALLGISTPAFWLAIILILVFGVYLRLLPIYGFVSPLEDPVECLVHLALPSVTLGVILAGTVTRTTRSSMLEVVRLDYIKFARLKGMSERTVLYKHALKNALIPIVTIVGIQIGYLLGGTVIIEQIFGWPGIGRLLLQAIYNRDYFLVQGAILVYALLFFIVNLTTDLIYAFVDPRIRFE
jgi:peptide/nickel transport system permease protein